MAPATTYTVESFEKNPVEGVAPTIARLAKEHGWFPFLTGARYAPEAMRGAETIAFELADQCPEASAVYVPVGGGGLLGSIWRGYRRLETAAPRMVGVQPRGCPTLRRGLAGELGPLEGPVTTTISGLQVSVLFDYGAVDAVTDSGGAGIEVDDQASWQAQALLAREEGIFVEPAGATALAGLLADVEAKELGRTENVIVVLTGAGHKDPVAVTRLSAGNEPHKIRADEVSTAFAEHREKA
jgi:threonine synthase